MKICLISAFAALVFTLFGCARDVRSELVSPRNHSTVAAEVAASDLSQPDRDAFAAAIARAEISSSYSVDGLTVSQIVSSEKHFVVRGAP